MRAQAKDVHEAFSDWSAATRVTVGAPSVPFGPYGPATGYYDSLYTFVAHSVDGEGDSIRYIFEWGDGTQDTTPFHASGDVASSAHHWSSPDTYSLRVLAQDQAHVASDWSDGLQIHIIDPVGSQKWLCPTDGSALTSPAIGADRTIYAASDDSCLYAISPEGTVNWRYRTQNRVVWASPAVGPDGTVYIGAFDGFLHAVSTDGHLRWRFHLGAPAHHTPAIGADGTIYMMGNSGSHSQLYAINPNGSEKWRCPLMSDGWSSPAIAPDGTLYFGTSGNAMYAVTADGVEKWNRNLGSAIYSSPAIGADGTIYVTTYGGALFALLPDGSEKWRYELGVHSWSSPVIGSDGTIYVGADDGVLYAVRPDGTIRWSYATDGGIQAAPVLVSDGSVCVGSAGIYCLDSVGVLKWKLDVDDWFPQSGPTIGPDSTLYVGSSHGYLYAIYASGHLASSPWPKFHNDLRNTGRVGDGR